MTLLTLTLAASPAFARAASETKRFDIPAGFAADTLKQFSAQTGPDERLLYAADSVEGVKTNAIAGEMKPREALDRMLAGTSLAVIEDGRTGALTISRAASLPKAHTASDSESKPQTRSENLKKPTKRTNPIALLIAWLGLAVAPTQAVQVAEGNTAAPPRSTGSITGQVSNAATLAFLEGAIVQVSGTDRVALTDREGRYQITGLPAGPVTLEVSYTGLTTKRMPATLSSSEKTVLDVALTSDVYMMDKFTVAGIREGQALALTQQRNAPNVKNVAAADAFGNVADGNAAEAIRLLPGVAALNDENESRYVMVRGIDANLNNTTVDGMKFSTGGASTNRQSDMSLIPLGAIESMEITKSPTPDMDGDSLGGNINLRTASIFDRVVPRRITYAVSASTRTGFDSTSPATTYKKDRVTPTFAFGYSDVFGPNKNFGIALNLSHTINWAPSSGLILSTWEATATGPAYLQNFSHYDYHATERKRSGASLRFDYKVSEHSRLFLNTSYFDYTSKQMFQGGAANVTALAQVATLDANGRPIPFQTQFPYGDPSYRAGGFNAAGARVQASIIPGYTDDYTEVVNSTYNVTSALSYAESQRTSLTGGGNHRYSNLELDYSATYQYNHSWSGGKDRRADYINSYNYRVLNTAWTLDGRKTGSLLRRSITQTGGPDVRNPANWAISSLTTAAQTQDTEIYGGQANLKYSFASPVPAFLKLGAKFMSDERSRLNPSISYTYAGPQNLIATLIDTRVPSNVPLGLSHPFGSAPPFLSTDKINQLKAEHPEYFTQNAATSLQTALQNDKIAKEEVAAAYIMGNVSLGGLSVLGGVRVERTTASGVSAVQDPRAGLTLTDPVERVRAQWGNRLAVEREYQNVLPGLHFKYAGARGWVLRASYAASYGRPSFASLYPDTRINYDSQTITQNNAGLLPQTADNFDVSIERYFEPVGVLSAGVFLKEIKNFLYSSTVAIPAGSDNGFDGAYAGWQLATQANGGRGRVRGVEINYSQQLSFLPGAWKGIGVFANFTYLDTRGNYGRVNEPANGELVNFVPKTGNAGISYSLKRLMVRVNANFTGTYLFSYNVNPALRQYQGQKNMVDLKLAYRIYQGTSLFLDVGNVFNGKDWRWRGAERYGIAPRNFGTRIQAGVNGSF